MHSLRVSLVSLLIFFAAGYAAILAWMVASGTSASIMVSSSMAPTFPRGSLAITQPAQLNEFEVGDLVGFRYLPEAMLKIHRVVEVNDAGELITQGDAVAERDAYPVNGETFEIRRVLFTSLVGGYAWSMVPWVIGGLLFAVAGTWFVRDSSTAALVALFALTVSWGAGVFVVAPVVSIDTIELASTADGQMLKLASVGLADTRIDVVSGQSDSDMTSVVDRVLGPGDILTASAPAEMTRFGATVKGVMNWKPFALSAGGYALWLFAVAIVWGTSLIRRSIKAAA